jgi:hypothetical protein
LWRLRCTKKFLLLATISALTLPLIAVDETRIIALCTWPLTLAWLDDVSKELSFERISQMWKWLIAPAVLVPIGVVWMGSTYWPYWL